MRRRALLLAAAAAPLLAVSCADETEGSGRALPLQVLGSKGVSPGKLLFPRALAVDHRTGRLYVVDRSGRIQLFLPDGSLEKEWRLPEHAFGQPVGLAIEADGSLLVNDSHYHRILRYAPDGSRILAQWGTEGIGPGQFTYGRDIVVDSQGFIYAGDYGGLNDRIQKFTRDGEFVREWGGMGEDPGKFQRPQGMTIERRGGEELLLVADCANHRVQRFTLDGTWVASIGRLGRGAGDLRYPHSVAVGRDGSIFVSEWGNNRVQRFDRDGLPLGAWGGPGHAVGELATPWDIAIGPEEKLYIADYGNHRVQVFRWPVSLSSLAPRRRDADRMPRS